MRAAPSFALQVLVTVALAGCARPARTCAASQDCAKVAACVAGRCQPAAGVPEVQSAHVRRIVAAPIASAYLRRGERAAPPPAVVVLGRAGQEALLYARFALDLTDAARVVEASFLLERVDALDADPASISLHAVRVVEPWDVATLSWALQPRRAGAPTTSAALRPHAARLVRLPARDVVLAWRKRDPAEQGVVVVTDGDSPTGVPFAPALLAEIYVK